MGFFSFVLLHFPFWEEEEGLTGSTEDEDGGRGGHDVGVDFLGWWVGMWVRVWEEKEMAKES